MMKHENKKPNSIVYEMYLEITNIAQGINLAALVIVLTTKDFYSSVEGNLYSPYLFSLANFFIIIIFWIRYYFDTEILKRSFTITSAIWFFCYVTAQGISISFLGDSQKWLFSTGIFLAFGAGFYILNILEIRRKSKAKVIHFQPDYILWQKRRIIDLVVVSLMSIVGAYLVRLNPLITPIIALMTLLITFGKWS